MANRDLPQEITNNLHQLPHTQFKFYNSSPAVIDLNGAIQAISYDDDYGFTSHTVVFSYTPTKITAVRTYDYMSFTWETTLDTNFDGSGGFIGNSSPIIVKTPL